MITAYEKIITSNLDKLFSQLPDDVERRMGCRNESNHLNFNAFGANCRMYPGGIWLNDVKQTGPLGIVLSLYGIHAQPNNLIVEPLKAFKEFPDSAPYAGAFTTHTEQVLIPHVEKIQNRLKQIQTALDGQNAPASVSGDFALIVRPLPKISLCYIFYEADEDFPASATCLYSNNANQFLPLDALADAGEYTSKIIIDLVTSKS